MDELSNFQNNIIKNLLKSEDDIKCGRVKNSEDVFKEWKEKYNI